MRLRDLGASQGSARSRACREEARPCPGVQPSPSAIVDLSAHYQLISIKLYQLKSKLSTAAPMSMNFEVCLCGPGTIFDPLACFGLWHALLTDPDKFRRRQPASPIRRARSRNSRVRQSYFRGNFPATGRTSGSRARQAGSHVMSHDS